MRVNVKGKNINIPEAWLQKTQRDLGLNLQDAVQLYLSDHDVIEPPAVVKEMSEKAKAAHVGAKATGEKKERKAPVRKPDEMKRVIVASLYDFLAQEGRVSALEVTNIERMIAFELAGDKYELTLTKKRKPKE